MYQEQSEHKEIFVIFIDRLRSNWINRFFNQKSLCMLFIFEKIKIIDCNQLKWFAIFLCSFFNSGADFRDGCCKSWKKKLILVKEDLAFKSQENIFINWTLRMVWPAAYEVIILKLLLNVLFQCFNTFCELFSYFEIFLSASQ